MYTFDEAYNASLDYFNGDDIAANVWVSKYALQDQQGKYLELTPEDMHRRLAREFARIEAKYPNALSEAEIFDLFTSVDENCKLQFGAVIPQGSPMSAVGNTHQIQSTSNCFVIDSPVDSYGGILLADQEQIQIMKRRGGVGFDISNIRPKGLHTENAAKTRYGSGWAWLVLDEQKKLKIGSTPNQDNPLMGEVCSGTPILCMDVWEHAYYLHYQNRRPDYVQAFFNVINWDVVSEKYLAAK
jgi:hypothetical protein